MTLRQAQGPGHRSIKLVYSNCTSCMICVRECPTWCINLESHGEPMAEICRALLRLCDRFPDVIVRFPVHLSPRVRATAVTALATSNTVEPAPASTRCTDPSMPDATASS